MGIKGEEQIFKKHEPVAPLIDKNIKKLIKNVFNPTTL